MSHDILRQLDLTGLSPLAVGQVSEVREQIDCLGFKRCGGEETPPFLAVVSFRAALKRWPTPPSPPLHPISLVPLLLPCCQRLMPLRAGSHNMDYPPTDEPNHLELRCNALPEHQMGLITSGCGRCQLHPYIPSLWFRSCCRAAKDWCLCVRRLQREGERVHHSPCTKYGLCSNTMALIVSNSCLAATAGPGRT